jgi:hypothetical protein
MIGRIKFPIAELIDRLNPRACWADLATWASGNNAFREIDFTGRCMRAEAQAASCGGCYCGKHRTIEAENESEQ